MRLVAPADLYYLSVIALIVAPGRFPSRLKRLLVRSIALAAYALSGDKRRRMERNVAMAFAGTLDVRARRRIVRGAFLETWGELFSYRPCRAERAAIRDADIHGADHLHAALARGRGAVLWVSYGFGRRFKAAQVLHAHGFPALQVYGPNRLGSFLTDDATASWVRRALVRRFFERCERPVTTGTLTLPHSGSLAFVRRLQEQIGRNGILCITADGKYGQRRIQLDMLGHAEIFTTGTVSLARASGTTILPTFCLEDTDGRVRVIIERPLTIDGAGPRERALEAPVREYARILEGYIRRQPERYRNWHLLGAPAPLA